MEHDVEQHRFELRLTEGTALLQYRRREPNTLVLLHDRIPLAESEARYRLFEQCPADTAGPPGRVFKGERE